MLPVVRFGRTQRTSSGHIEKVVGGGWTCMTCVYLCASMRNRGTGGFAEQLAGLGIG